MYGKSEGGNDNIGETYSSNSLGERELNGVVGSIVGNKNVVGEQKNFTDVVGTPIEVNEDERRIVNGKGVDHKNISAMGFNTDVIGLVEAPFEDIRTSPNDPLSLEPAVSQNPDQNNIIDLGVVVANSGTIPSWAEKIDNLNLAQSETHEQENICISNTEEEISGDSDYSLPDFTKVMRAPKNKGSERYGLTVLFTEDRRRRNKRYIGGYEALENGYQGVAIGEFKPEVLVTEVMKGEWELIEQILQTEINVFQAFRDESALAAYGGFLLLLTSRECEIELLICCELEKERRRKIVFQLKREALLHNYFLNDIANYNDLYRFLLKPGGKLEVV
ncbi:hypothetical protein V6N13_024698 [Hibiscus sabdariffa]|uniref:Uncharacterized protein n=1 Tax=Hibiscus sabdariffa TaxID=183260 RepID=A0ABR2DVE9_9ROSI